jgi:hypothetical protein
VKKELRPVHDHVTCDVCGRTILKGERTEAYIAPGGHRRTVCELCFTRAEHHGWIRESTADELPSRTPRDEPRRSLLGRLRRRPEPAVAPPSAPRYESSAPVPESGWESGYEGQPEPGESPDQPAAPPPRPRSRPKDPRHVRAVPTNVEGRIERALELYNTSAHQRTTAGLARTLGTPWVTAAPDPAQPSLVTVLVAWELSWYRYQVDLGDELDPVVLVEKGEELDQIDESLRDWNASSDAEGRLVAGHVVTGGGGDR